MVNKKVLSVVLGLLCCCLSCSTTNHKGSSKTSRNIFPVKKGCEWGLMNRKGKWEIQPAYHAVKEFTEGLAAVRKGGLYGYINTSGSFVIPPKYDYAYPFTNGIAKVFKGSKPVYINKNGETIFNHNYASLIYNSKADHFVIESASGKYGAIDYKGKLVIDTIYNRLTNNPGYGYIAELPEPRNKNLRVIAYSGEILIPEGNYKVISNHGEGWVNCYNYDNQNQKRLINLKDTSKAIIVNGINHVGLFSNGLAVVTSQGKGRTQVLDTSGKITKIENAERILSDFSSGSAVLRDTSGSFYIIDKSLKPVAGPFPGHYSFDLPAGLFSGRSGNDKAFYSLKTGKLLLKGNYEVEKYEFSDELYQFTRYNNSNKAVEEGLINDKGKVIWTDNSSFRFKCWNIDYQLDNYVKFERKGNFQVDIDLTKDSVYFQENDRFFLRSGAKRMYFINASKDTLLWSPFSDVKITVEVQKRNGKWMSIMARRLAMCGTPGGKTSFYPGEYWDFRCPVFSGSVKTKMRLSVNFRVKSGENKVVKSEEISCGINPAQLWRSKWSYDILDGGYW